MAFDDSNSGSLSRNEKKSAPNQPDYKGSIMVDGVPHWISGWDKKGQYGPFVSLQIQPKDESKEKGKAKPKKEEEEEKSEGLFPF